MIHFLLYTYANNYNQNKQSFVLALLSLANKISTRSCYFYLVQIEKCLTSLDRSISVCTGVPDSAVHGVPGITRVIHTSDYGNVELISQIPGDDTQHVTGVCRSHNTCHCCRCESLCHGYSPRALGLTSSALLFLLDGERDFRALQ